MAHALRQLLIHQDDAQFIGSAVEQLGEAIEFAEHLHDAREILQRHARVSGFEPLQRGYRNTAAFSQGSAGQPPASASS